MKIQAIVAHPRSDSFCHSIFNQAIATLQKADHEIVIHDLYEEEFDPVLKSDEAYTVGDSIEQVLSKVSDPVLSLHRQEIYQAEGLLIAHPNWWGKPPAMLAGWLDRVLVPGVAYRLQTAEGEPEGLLSMDTALVLNTSDTPPDRGKRSTLHMLPIGSGVAKNRYSQTQSTQHEPITPQIRCSMGRAGVRVSARHRD